MRAVLMSVAALAIACSKSAPEPGRTVGIADVCNGEDHARVRLSGYLRYPRGLMSFCSTIGGKTTCDLSLYESAEKPADYNVMRPRTGPEPLHARLSVPVGDAPGEMADLPEKFTAADVVMHLPDKKTATDGTRVTIDGKLSVIPGSNQKSCFVTVEWAIPAS